jgi:2-dehydropantoate 2-reductase
VTKRFVVYGAGAVGGVIGARLHEHGHEVVLIARGKHLAAIRTRGLQLDSPEGSATFELPAVEHPADLELGANDVVLLATKTQDTAAALRELALTAPPRIPVVCAQNGVENERAALRLFPSVYGVHVMLPAAHLEPGVVEAHSSPVTGLLDVGRYPGGCDATAEAIASAFGASSFDARAREDIMRWKYRKLIMNLGNAVEAVIEPSPERDEIERRAAEEGEACLRAAGIDFASREEDRERRGRLMRVQAVGGRERPGGSSWQSLARGMGTIEADYLNGEIALLGRMHGVPAPVNQALQRLAGRWAAERRRPGTLSAADFEAEVEDEPNGH